MIRLIDTGYHNRLLDIDSAIIMLKRQIIMITEGVSEETEQYRIIQAALGQLRESISHTDAGPNVMSLNEYRSIVRDIRNLEGLASDVNRKILTLNESLAKKQSDLLGEETTRALMVTQNKENGIILRLRRPHG